MVAIIPARGGSKGLPGKNIKDLNGKPLIAYTIEAALNAKSIRSIIVSTDDIEIAEESKKCGAQIPFMRPSYLATDDSKAIDVYLFTVDELIKRGVTEIDEICVLLPTCPLRTFDDIDEAIRLFKIKNADSVISYTKETHPITWHQYIEDDGKLNPFFEALQIDNRQAYRPTYYPNGAIYIFKTSLLRINKYYSENSYAYIMPRERSVDIDTFEDFEYAKYLLNRNGEKL